MSYTFVLGRRVENGELRVGPTGSVVLAVQMDPCDTCSAAGLTFYGRPPGNRPAIGPCNDCFAGYVPRDVQHKIMPWIVTEMKTVAQQEDEYMNLGEKYAPWKEERIIDAVMESGPWLAIRGGI